MFLQASVPAVVEVEVAPLFPVGCEGGRGSPHLPKELSQASNSPLVAPRPLVASPVKAFFGVELWSKKTRLGIIWHGMPGTPCGGAQASSGPALAMNRSRKQKRGGGHG